MYFYMTTATTVGYGDLSPGSIGGRLAAVLFILPGSIALFTVFLGKVVSATGGFWRRRLQGNGDFSERVGHTLVVGWQGSRSRRLIEGLTLDQHPQTARTVLLARGLAENPMPDVLDFVVAEQLSDLPSYTRAGAGGAAVVVLRGADDDETLAATLAAHSAAPKAHIVAHFQEEGAARLIRDKFPDIEVITSIAAGLLARAARDPGASQLAALMFAGDSADTAFSMKIPAGAGPLGYIDVMVDLKRTYGLTLIGVCRNGASNVDLNCASDCEVNAGDILFYIADNRVTSGNIDWARLQSETMA
jgi:voltage-gated potassium channel